MIRPVSKARARKNREYEKLKKEWRSKLINAWCKVCGQPSEKSPHHVRGRVGRLLCDTRFWIPVCRACHDRIHMNPKWASVNGYMCDWGKTSDL